MISVTAATATALGRAARRFVVSVRALWPGDASDASRELTAWVESMDVDRSLASDLPEGVRQVQGFASAECTVVLAGRDFSRAEGLDTPAALLAPYSTTSPLYKTRRLRAPLQASVGVASDDGTEVIRRFTGTVRSITTQAGARTVTIVGADAADIQVTPNLPVIVAFYQSGITVRAPGLNAQWVVDYLLRKAGIYASPPARATAVLSATMHGSMYPEVADSTSGVPLTSAYDQSVPYSRAVQFEQGKFALAASAKSRAAYQMADGVGGASGQNILVEFWMKAPSVPWTTAFPIFVYDAFTSETIEAGMGNSAGVMGIRYTRPAGGSTTINGPTLPTDGAWHYLGFFIEFTSTTAWRCTFNLDGVVTGPTSGAALAAGGSAAEMDLAVIVIGQPMEALQVAKSIVSVTWNHAFSPTAILERSLLELFAVPLVESSADGWDVIKDIAAAELGTAGKTEDGTFRYRNRYSWSATVVRTVTVEDITSLAIEETTDSVVNRLRVPYSALTVQAPTLVWQNPEATRVNRLSTITLTASFDTPVIGIQTGYFAVLPVGGGVTGYRASRNADGSGGEVSNLQIYAKPFTGMQTTITIVNPNPFAVYLVSPSGAGYPSTSDGQPTLVIAAQAIAESSGADLGGLSSTGAAVEKSNPDSIAASGDRLYEMAVNPWRQSQADAEQLAEDLLADLYEGRPTLRDITIRADPRLQLGDRVQIVDAAGLRLDEPGWVTDIRETWSRGSGAQMVITVRLVAMPGQWILGVTGRDELGTNTNL